MGGRLVEVGFCGSRVGEGAYGGRGGRECRDEPWVLRFAQKLEGSVHEAVALRKRLWHLHWPAIEHYHDYDSITGSDLEAGSLYNLVRQAREEGRLEVHGDPLTDECLEKLKSHDPLIYDESLRRDAQKLCVD